MFMFHVLVAPTRRPVRRNAKCRKQLGVFTRSTVGDITPCNTETDRETIATHLMLPFNLKENTLQYFYLASGCTSSDVSVRPEFESLSLPLPPTEHSLLLPSVTNLNSQHPYVFAMDNKASPSFYQHLQQVKLSLPLLP
jgi:hypothetical protein